MTFLPLYNIFLFHTPHPHKGDGLTAVPFVFCFFNHPPARIPPHCAHYSAVRTHQHTNPDYCCTHSNERGQPGKTACRKTPAAPPTAPPRNTPVRPAHPRHNATIPADRTSPRRRRPDAHAPLPASASAPLHCRQHTRPKAPADGAPPAVKTSPRTAQTPRSAKATPHPRNTHTRPKAPARPAQTPPPPLDNSPPPPEAGTHAK